MNARQYRNIDRHIGLKIRQLRSARGLSLDQLALAVAMEKTAINRYELGRVRVPASVLWNIARTLQIELGEFFGGVGETVPVPVIRHARLFKMLAELPDDKIQRALAMLIADLHSLR